MKVTATSTYEANNHGDRILPGRTPWPTVKSVVQDLPLPSPLPYYTHVYK